MNRPLTLVLLGWLSVSSSVAQISLLECHDAARANYPVIKQYELIRQTREYDLKNASMAQIPQVSLSAQATYQTAVTTVPIPSVDIKTMSKDQYKVVAEVSQSIWDGGVTASQKKIITATADVDNKSIDVDLYALNERVDNLFFGILMLDEQLVLNTLFDQELQRNYRNVESYISGGIANSADLDAVQVEILNNRQQRVAIRASREAYVKMLSEMVGFTIDGISKPERPSISDNEIKRPELSLFESQKERIDLQRTTITARTTPKFGAFVQGAYGNPGLDMLKAGFTLYAIGGVKLSWNFGGYYTRKGDLAKLELQRSSVDIQRESFLYNTNLLLIQTQGEVRRIEEQMRDDDEIIRLRNNIKKSAQAKVEQGTLTVNDMLREVTAENSAIRNRALHGVELLKTLYEYKNKTNN